MIKGENKRNTYKNRQIIMPAESSRIWYGELNHCDFCTAHPNPYNIDKTDIGIQQYLAFKKRKKNI